MDREAPDVAEPLTFGTALSVEYRDLGAYYTPPSLADSLASWAVRTGQETVLEPSIGGGALAAAVLRQALAITGQPFRGKLFGCDLNPNVIQNWPSNLTEAIQFTALDFFDLDPAVLPSIDVVIANPPFTRNHTLSAVARRRLRERFDVRGAAGLWVHFLVHSMAFLAEGARLISLVPAVASSTVYGNALLERLRDRFEEVSVVPLDAKPNWHVAADERGALIRAEGFRRGGIKRSSRSSPSPVDDSSDAAIAYRRLEARAVELGTIAALSIGAVTGRNRVFLLSSEESKRAGIGRKDLRPIVSRAGQLRGLHIDTTELISLADQGERTWLLSPEKLDKAAETHLEQITIADRQSTAWLRKRDPWWKVGAGPECDGVFTYMNHVGPRLVLTGPGIVCTNTLHRVCFVDGLTAEERLWAVLSLISTFGQLASEKIGRVYGGGVLKFELMEARRLPVLIQKNSPSAASVASIDAALRSRDYELARSLADAIVLPPFMGDRWQSDAATLSDELAQLRAKRLGSNVAPRDE